MCIVAVKHFADVGWVGIKNRDRNYKPDISIKHSRKAGIERLLMKDNKTKYVEGLNEFGVAILSTGLSYRTSGGPKGDSLWKKIRDKTSYWDTDGNIIGKALLEKTVEKAMKVIIDSEVKGNTIVFSATDAYLIEGYFKNNETKTDYSHKVIKLDENKEGWDFKVRTNHVVSLDGNTVDPNNELEVKAIASSENRYKVTKKLVSKVEVFTDMIAAMSDQSHKDPQMSPMRITKKMGLNVNHTTGQIMCVPKKLTLHYRPIWCDTSAEFDKLNHKATKTKFEIVSSHELIAPLKEAVERLNFRSWYYK
jgi:hypothetical protein